MILREMRVKAILCPLICSPLSSFFAVASKFVLVTVVVRPSVNGRIIERIDEQGFLFCQDWRPIVVALGQWLTMRMSFRKHEITLASGCAGGESRKYRKLSKVHGGISMPIAPHNSNQNILLERGSFPQKLGIDGYKCSSCSTAPYLFCHVMLPCNDTIAWNPIRSLVFPTNRISQLKPRAVLICSNRYHDRAGPVELPFRASQLTILSSGQLPSMSSCHAGSDRCNLLGKLANDQTGLGYLAILRGIEERDRRIIYLPDMA